MDSTFPSPGADALAPPAIPAPSAPAYRDRSTGLIVFGILQIIFGGFCLLMIPFILFSAVMSRKMTGNFMPAGNYVLSIVSYTLAAALTITLGVGSICARRWAWALTLVLSWCWLVMGALSTVMITALVPSVMLTSFRAASASRPDAAGVSTVVVAVITTLMIAFAAIFLVVLPIVFVTFYRRPDVEATVRHRDPVESWTDRTPLPVLAASLMLATGAVYCVLMSFTTPLLPILGRYVTGVRAGVLLLAIAAVDGALAHGLFKRRPVAWWIAVITMIFRLVSSAATFGRANLIEAYSKMGWSSQQLQMMQANPGLRSGVFLYWGLLFSVLLLGYMIWIKRYFRPADVQTSISADPLPSA